MSMGVLWKTGDGETASVARSDAATAYFIGLRPFEIEYSRFILVAAPCAERSISSFSRLLPSCLPPSATTIVITPRRRRRQLRQAVRHPRLHHHPSRPIRSSRISSTPDAVPRKRPRRNEPRKAEHREGD